MKFQVATGLQETLDVPSPRLRRFRPADLPAVAAIERACFGRWAYPDDLFLEYAGRAPDLFLVALIGPAVAAYSIAGRERHPAELISIAVAPEFRRTGVARRLLEATIRRLRRAGECRLRLVVKENNRAARAFYERAGFRRERRLPGYYEDGRDGLRMVLEL